mgnify:CR=1 FL=1
MARVCQPLFPERDDRPGVGRQRISVNDRQGLSDTRRADLVELDEEVVEIGAGAGDRDLIELEALEISAGEFLAHLRDP